MVDTMISEYAQLAILGIGIGAIISGVINLVVMVARKTIDVINIS